MADARAAGAQKTDHLGPRGEGIDVWHATTCAAVAKREKMQPLYSVRTHTENRKSTQTAITTTATTTKQTLRHYRITTKYRRG